MKCKDLLYPTDYKFIEINNEEYFFEKLDEDIAFNILKGEAFKCNNMKDFICNLAKRRWYEGAEIIDHIKDSKAFQTNMRKKDKTLNIALYYHSIQGGGAQRITAMLANLFSHIKKQDKRKYKIVLITDEKKEKKNLKFKEDEEYLFDKEFYQKFVSKEIKEYEIDGLVKREYLPSFKEAKEDNYHYRYDRLHEIIDKHHLDIIISGLWTEPCTFFDMLTIKSHKSHPAFILHNHNYHLVPFLYKGDTAIRMMKMYAMCDGVIVLSREDEAYIKSFTNRVKYIPNPIPYKTNSPLSNYQKDTLLWVARLSKEKAPLDVIKMMNILVKKRPDIKLYMVGTGDAHIIDEVVTMINEYHLKDNIILTGFSNDVDQYYKEASIFISTSLYEGFPTTSAEAMSFGLPIVEYEMPWLEFSKDRRGIIEVTQKDYKAMAKEILKLLNNPKMIKEIGLKGKEKINEFIKYNIQKDWEQFFKEVAYNPHKKINIDKTNELITLFSQLGKADLANALHQEYDELYETHRITSTKLRRAYMEKSEINAELVQKYKDDAERGQSIDKLINIIMPIKNKMKKIKRRIKK